MSNIKEEFKSKKKRIIMKKGSIFLILLALFALVVSVVNNPPGHGFQDTGLVTQITYFDKGTNFSKECLLKTNGVPNIFIDKHPAAPKNLHWRRIPLNIPDSNANANEISLISEPRPFKTLEVIQYETASLIQSITDNRGERIILGRYNCPELPFLTGGVYSIGVSAFQLNSAHRNYYLKVGSDGVLWIQDEPLTVSPSPSASSPPTPAASITKTRGSPDPRVAVFFFYLSPESLKSWLAHKYLEARLL